MINILSCHAFFSVRAAQTVQRHLQSAEQKAKEAHLQYAKQANMEPCDVVGCIHPRGHGVHLHDPSVTGYWYNTFLVSGGGHERGSWPLPTEHVSTLYVDDMNGTHAASTAEPSPLPGVRTGMNARKQDTVIASGSDCRKKFEAIVGHTARCALWVWLCIDHQKVCAYHVIKRAEGQRDAVLSLYRFKKDPPEILFVDFACHAEEVALNWVPEFFSGTRFNHDTFHGFSHVCSSRFSQEHLLVKPATNSSIMEQFNGFLGPLRGLILSGSTRVSVVTCASSSN